METASKNGALPARNEIDNKYKWKLEDMYETPERWEADLVKAKSLLEKLTAYSGTFSKDISNLKACLSVNADLSMLAEKLFSYARMRRDENNGQAVYQSLTDRASMLLTEIASLSAFIEPEILGLEEALLKKLILHENEYRDFEIYAHYLDNLLRQKSHTLSAAEEKIVAMTTEFSDAGGEIFTMLNNADIRFPVIKDESGNDVELTKGRFITFLESKDRSVRKAAFEAMYETYTSYKNTLAGMLGSNVKTNNFYTKVRKYPSIIAGALDSDNVPLSVYDNLIDAVSDKLPALHQYLAIRKSMLRLDDFHLYDMYVPFIDVPEKKYTYEEAVDIVLEAMQPLGETYIRDLRHAFSSGWIDAYENQGKTSGAYSWGAYLSHPYVLLNFQGKIDDIFTIAHEMGHALHSYNTDRTQHYVNSHYKIFVAEVASTVNELLLMNYFLKKAANANEKAFFLSKFIDDFRATVFRQVMFAEFEKIIHATYESGEPLTCEKFCEIYYGLNKKYFGENVVIDDEIAMEWARIPHFYSSFYVYKYATGFSSAVAISDMILNDRSGDGSAIKNYMEFLCSGGSDYPIPLLKKTGVDLTTSAPVKNALNVFHDLIVQLESLCKEI